MVGAVSLGRFLAFSARSVSGSLDDGSRGLAAIHKAGGLSMVLTPGGAAGARDARMR
jgi:hypothetical protein